MLRQIATFATQENRMKKTILVFGLISGAVSSLLMVSTMVFANNIGFDRGLIVGYTAIVLSFLLVYFGIRSYRDNIGEGQITFARGFAVGICITLISCLVYVVSWEILYFNYMPGFMDKYNAHVIEQLRNSGASAAAIQAKAAELKKATEMYNHVLFNAAMTFIEPFPVGLVITLLSAAILRKRSQGHAAQSVLSAS
jgi:ABC-type microcin C transport system permease subunit YejB